MSEVYTWSFSFVEHNGERCQEMWSDEYPGALTCLADCVEHSWESCEPDGSDLLPNFQTIFRNGVPIAFLRYVRQPGCFVRLLVTGEITDSYTLPPHLRGEDCLPSY